MTSSLDKIRNGDGQLFYPSGRVCLTVCKSPDGCYHTFTADSDSFLVLALLDNQGVGSVNYANGKPWLVITRDGWSLSNAAGTIVQKGHWPRPASEPAITLEVSPELSFTFRDRQHLVARISMGDLVKEMQVGEHLKRSEGTYLEKVTAKGPGGRLELDVDRIRQRIEDVGSVYMQRGPSHFQTIQPGLGNLRSMVATITKGSELAAAVADLDRTQARLHALSSLTAHASSRPASGSVGASTSGTGAGGGGGSSSRFPDLGSPQLSEAQKKIAAKLAKTSGAFEKKPYVVRRRKLRLLSLSEFDSQVAGPGAPATMLCVVCALADWNPACAKLENGELQAAAFELEAEAAANKGSEAGCIQLFKFDAASSALQQRYKFRYVPFFLFFFRGKLVAGTDSIRTREQLREAALSALAAGRRGEFRDAGFEGAESTLLDSIRPDMSLLTA